MADPFTLDGGTLLASYEHVRRTIELNGFTFNGWSEMTGGGVTREGQVHVYGAGDSPRGVTDGKAKPQNLELKLEVFTWETLKVFLEAQALANGDTSDTAYQKVEWTIVDQYRGATVLQQSVTITTTVKIAADKPETPNDGGQFYQAITLIPVGIPSRS